MKAIKISIVAIFYLFFFQVNGQNITYTSNITGPSTYNWVMSRGASGTVASLPSTIQATDSVIVKNNPCNLAETNPSGACAGDVINFTNCITETLSSLNGVFWVKAASHIRINITLNINSGGKLFVDTGAKTYVNGSLINNVGGAIQNKGRLDVNGSITNYSNIYGGGLIRCCGASINFAPGNVYGMTTNGGIIGCGGAGLPVKLLSFKADKDDKRINFKLDNCF